jgi:hypothetical protein
MRRELFSREVIDALPEVHRTARLRELQSEVCQRVNTATSVEAFYRESRRVVDELKTLGHDLWSWDSDGENVETWGGDYMRPAVAGRLIINFEFGEGARVEWWTGLGAG